MAVSAPKTPDYYRFERGDLVARLPRPLGRVLDVGCGAGPVGRSAREAGATEVVGIEIEPSAAEVAATHYDHVHVGSVDDILPTLAEGSFDTILCYDILEHLVDPWSTLRGVWRLGTPSSHLHVSMPNARHLSLPYDTLLRGTWGYADVGHRDITHLRWFTPRDLYQALRDAAWEPLSHTHTDLAPWRQVAANLTGGRSSEFLAHQWHVLARHAPGPVAGSGRPPHA
jgi:2-polyprenyl-3-methyl-5-hydroxy-6-metoxy-1,4-benzoquinol methylase